MIDEEEHILGVLLGTAVGDALGLPAEGLSRKRNHKLFKGIWYHRFIFGKGMWSDDTEHTFFVAQALIEHGDDVQKFQKKLASKLKWWLVALPAGVGLATARSIIKLWLGFKPSRSGVFSAGNGPAMRAAIIGAVYHGQKARIEEFIRASTVMTHSDPKATTGALAVALAASYYIENPNGHHDELLKELLKLSDPSDHEWSKWMAQIKDSCDRHDKMDDFLINTGLESGVSGYVYQTVPVALYAVFSNPTSFDDVIVDVFNAGGDTDTVGAIAGAIAGAKFGCHQIPSKWTDGIIEWPRTMGSLREVGQRLASGDTSPVKYFWPGLIVRNLFFLIIVLLHGFRRLLPPY